MRFKSSLIFILVAHFLLVFFLVSLSLSLSVSFLIAMFPVSRVLCFARCLSRLLFRAGVKLPCRLLAANRRFSWSESKHHRSCLRPPSPIETTTMQRTIKSTITQHSIIRTFPCTMMKLKMLISTETVSMLGGARQPTILGKWGFWHRLIRHKKHVFLCGGRGGAKNFGPIKRNWGTWRKNQSIRRLNFVKWCATNRQKIKRNAAILMNLEICSSRETEKCRPNEGGKQNTIRSCA